MSQIKYHRTRRIHMRLRASRAPHDLPSRGGSPRARRQRVRLFGTWSGLAVDLASKVPTEHPDAREPSHPGNDDPMTVPAAFAGESVDSMVVTGTYNPYLVALSILVASVASYTALDLGGHVAAARGLARRAWLVAAAITMGGGIWSMHFIGMLAFVMPIPMSYDIGLTALSLVVAIIVTGGAFYIISPDATSRLRLAFGGIF